MDELSKVDISANILFSTVTSTLERIQSTAGHPKKVAILSGYFEKFAKFRDTFTKSNVDCNSSIYPVLRLIIPKKDVDRDRYGIQTYTFGQIYVRILGVQPKSDVAKRLTAKCSSKDYPNVVYDVMKNRCCDVCKLTVYDVNKHLDTIADCYNNNNRKKIDDEIIKMVQGMTAIDQKWLVRIILKDMNLGIKPGTILTTFNPSAKEFLNQYSSLSRVCQAVENGEVYEDSASVVELFRRCNPMLCQRGTVEKLQSLLGHKEYYLETKMDGERFHMHIKDGEYKYFSRGGHEFNSFGSNKTNGSLTPFVEPLFKVAVKNLILDGEMMVYNKEHLVYHTKGEHFDVKAIQPNDSTRRPCFVAYDILYFNDQSLINKPYAERSRLLASLFNEKPGVLTMCKPIKIRDSDHIIECLNKAFDQKEEGVVIKESDSVYAPGKRISSWIKIKPDYIDGLVSDFDLLVIGGYYNPSNKFIYKYLLGVQKILSSSKSEFVAVCNISSGLSTSKRIEINEKLKPYWKNCAHTKAGRSTVVNNPPGMNFGSQTPDVWIQPEHSIIFEVRASELVSSTSYGTPYTLRFPRIESLRTDKSWYDCCQLEEYESVCLSNSKVEKAVKRHITDTDINAMPPKRTRQSTNDKKTKFSAPSNVGNINLLYDNVPKVDRICEGKEFCVLNTANNLPPLEELHQMILRHGGKVVQNPTKHTFVAIAATESLRVSKLKEAKMCNIATVNWLMKAVGANVPLKKLIRFHPSDMLSCTNETAEEFRRKYDKYSDSFTKKVSVGQLKSVLDSMDEKDLDVLDRNEIYQLEADMEGDQSKPANMFRLATGLFWNPGKWNKKMDLAKEFFKFRGGKVKDSIDNLSHIFVDPDGFDVKQLLTEHKVGRKEIEKIRFVSYEWLMQCFNLGKKCNAKSFLLAI
ncbi:hypothetical protein HA402_002559 [Bradysia odoriphaga]|nr:hypothetical protein HA402_002559 [Bradysia odoriphaga]